MSEISNNLKSEQQWLRGLFMLLFVVVFELAKILLICVTVLQFLFVIIGGEANINLQRFGNSLGQYVKQISDYLTYNSDVKPFPFATWPEPVEAIENAQAQDSSQDNS